MPQIVKSRILHSAYFKAQLIIAGITNKLSINELIKHNEISVILYYTWKKHFISAVIIVLERQKSHAPKPAPSRNSLALKFTGASRHATRKATDKFFKRMRGANDIFKSNV